jgi:hypothetical protein
MKPILWFILGVAVAISGQALADQYVDSYGNGLDYLRGYSTPPGSAAVKNRNGTISPPPVLSVPSHQSPC